MLIALKTLFPLRRKQQHLSLLFLLPHADPMFPNTRAFHVSWLQGRPSQKRLCARRVLNFPEGHGAYAEIQSYRVRVLLKTIGVPCQGLNLGV